jgi:hypothetical protein
MKHRIINLYLDHPFVFWPVATAVAIGVLSPLLILVHFIS